ncbi:nickel pincer cofactor biosynthesis protein LarC [Desulfitibacter alkalitolerans]|uniref:nickel pincer cofactor biosynthesis protein LarC n=1 Tax=Desulfitibacter alkalitolerans TaxID=264641 RepID=UPI00047F3D14|nr:nickel pincer cofactor biosynthesis protein LarC [Desulfitibacter alkalitolerans]
MNRILYFDCSAGASGDMTLGALLHLGVKVDDLNAELGKLPVKGFQVSVQKVKKRGIEALKAEVLITEEDAPHRGLTTIKNIINESTLDGKVKDIAIKIFTKLGEAEAKIHGTTVDKIHFHEVGAIDAIVDIVGTAILIDRLQIDEVYASSIHTGSGFVTCQHGIMPIPAPATLELLKGVPIYSTEIKGELTTPTGAAILSTLAKEFGRMPLMKVDRIGYGAGTKDLAIPNVLRVSLGYLQEGQDSSNQEACLDHHQQWMLECNIDDMNHEFIDHIMGRLFQAGARDVYITPIQMKKNRPALKLSVLYGKEIEEKVFSIIFTETTSIGIRKYPVEKVMLDRKTQSVETPWGNVNVKLAYYKGDLANIAPEYEDCKRLAEKTGLPIKHIYSEVNNLIKNML